MFLVTTRVSILANETTTDDYDDEIHTHKLIKRDVPANIYEKNKSVWDATMGRHTTVTTYGAYLPVGTVIAKDYRLKDKNDRIYNVEAVHDRQNVIGAMPIQVDLKRLDTPRT